MSVIRREDESPLSIAEAKSLLGGALPYERGVDVYMSIGADGNVDIDGPIELRDEDSNMYGGPQLARAVKDACAQRLITPRFKYRPTLTDYTGAGDDDANYTISHAELLVLAKLYGIRVEVRSPKTVQVTAQDGAELLGGHTNVYAGTPPKLTEAERQEVVRLFNRGRGETVYALAVRFDVSRPTIDRVLKRAGIKT